MALVVVLSSPWVTRSGTSAVKVAAAAAFSESLFIASYPINPATFSLGDSPSSMQVSLDSSILTVLTFSSLRLS